MWLILAPLPHPSSLPHELLGGLTQACDLLNRLAGRLAWHAMEVVRTRPACSASQAAVLARQAVERR
eukprot:6155757-Prymnesium_polylepis.1